jgi:plastocyanin domain-containing protein
MQRGLFTMEAMTRRAIVTLALAALAACQQQDSGRAASASATPGDAQRVKITATKGGFEPSEVHLEQGRDAILEFTRVDETPCVEAVKMPWMDRPVDLPLHEKVEIRVPDMSKAGTFTYACWMNMVYGRVVVDPR